MEQEHPTSEHVKLKDILCFVGICLLGGGISGQIVSLGFYKPSELLFQSEANGEQIFISIVCTKLVLVGYAMFKMPHNSDDEANDISKRRDRHNRDNHPWIIDHNRIPSFDDGSSLGQVFHRRRDDENRNYPNDY